MKREIELKIQLDDTAVLKAWLQKHATYVLHNAQTDYYFDDPKSTFFYTSEYSGKDSDHYLRVRATRGSNVLCFKKAHRDADGKYLCNDEYEVGVRDADDAIEFLKSLGYEHVTTIAKERTVYTYDMFEIALDTVQGLGEFVEIELQVDVASVSVGHNLIYDFLRMVGIKAFKIQPLGYTNILWNPDLDLTKEVVL